MESTYLRHGIDKNEKEKAQNVYDSYNWKNFKNKPWTGNCNGKENYQELSRIGVPQRAIEVSDAVFVADNELLRANMYPQAKKMPFTPKSGAWNRTLDLYTGQNLKSSRKEQAPLFDLFKEDYLPNKNDLMNKALDQAGRYRDETSFISKQFEKPIESVRVGPGLNLGYTNENTNQPFHEMYRVNAKNRDELTGKVKPTFAIDRTDGALMGDNSYIIPNYLKLERDDAVYGQPKGGVIRNIFGSIIKPIKYPDELVEKDKQNCFVTDSDMALGTFADKGTGSYNLPTEMNPLNNHEIYGQNLNNIVNVENRMGKTDTQVPRNIEVRPQKAIYYQDQLAKTQKGHMVPIVYKGTNQNTMPNSNGLDKERKLGADYSTIDAMGNKKSTARGDVLNPLNNNAQTIQYIRTGGDMMPVMSENYIPDTVNLNNMKVPMKSHNQESRRSTMPTNKQQSNNTRIVQPMNNINTKKHTISTYSGGVALFGKEQDRSNIKQSTKSKSMVIQPGTSHRASKTTHTYKQGKYTKYGKHQENAENMNKYNQKQMHESYKVATDRLAADGGPRPWPKPSSWRFTPEYSWQVNDPTEIKSNKMKRLPTIYNRVDGQIFHKPIMKFKKANFN